MKCNDGELTKIIEWKPAWDKRDPDPKKDYGISSVNLRFILKGPKGVTQLLIFTHWVLPQNRGKWDEMTKAFFLQPMPADLGYHAYVPQCEDQTPISDSCDDLEGKPCYYDGSGLQAEQLFDEFVAKGEEVIWTRLKEQYDDLIGPEEVIP